jgi:hypothetical protein
MMMNPRTQKRIVIVLVVLVGAAMVLSLLGPGGIGGT